MHKARAKTKQMEQIKQELQTIKEYCLLGAKNVLTLEDVVLLTGLTKQHIYKLTHNRVIPYYRPNGKNLYFDRSEIEAWLKQGKVSTLDEMRQNCAIEAFNN